MLDRLRRALLATAPGAGLPGVAAPASAEPPETPRAGVGADGAEANGERCRGERLARWGKPALGDDGRFVAFTSAASTLVPGDTSGRGDVFVHRR